MLGPRESECGYWAILLTVTIVLMGAIVKPKPEASKLPGSRWRRESCGRSWKERWLRRGVVKQEIATRCGRGQQGRAAAVTVQKWMIWACVKEVQVHVAVLG
jgi:hypothetical protein